MYLSHLTIFVSLLRAGEGTSNLKLIKRQSITTAENYEFDCSTVTAQSDYIVSCSSMCYEPDTVLWRDLYSHLIYDKELEGEQIKCSYFAHKKETTNGCSFCLVYDSVLPNLLTIDKETVDFIPNSVNLYVFHSISYL